MQSRPFSEKSKGGWKTQERGRKHTNKPSPQKVLDPPTYDTFSPPPICPRHVIVFGGNGHRPDKSQFLRPPKVVLDGGTLQYVPPPPPQKNRTIRFAPPFAISQRFCAYCEKELKTQRWHLLRWRLTPCHKQFEHRCFRGAVRGRVLDGRNRAIVIAESLARVIVAIRTTSAR